VGGAVAQDTALEQAATAWRHGVAMGCPPTDENA